MAGSREISPAFPMAIGLFGAFFGSRSWTVDTIAIAGWKERALGLIVFVRFHKGTPKVQLPPHLARDGETIQVWDYTVHMNTNAMLVAKNHRGHLTRRVRSTLAICLLTGKP
jgi:hypothetical protein